MPMEESSDQPAWIVERDIAQKKSPGSGGCPYQSAEGKCTQDGRLDWIKAHGFSVNDDIPTSLEADLDQTKPLYYWQLHSVMGPKLIEKIVSRFYTRVYNDDENPKFRDAFKTLNGLEHQISKQTHFWIDVFGGGKLYLGGEYAIKYHHKQPLAVDVMNADGATRWMYHMGEVLCSLDFSDVDVRIKPCIIDFLRTKMLKYANEHQWKFSNKDFDFVKKDPEMIRLYEREIALYDFNMLESLSYQELIDFLEFNGISIPRRLISAPPSTCSLWCGGGGHHLVIMRELVDMCHEALKARLETQLQLIPNMSREELSLFLDQRGLFNQVDQVASAEDSNLRSEMVKEEMIVIAQSAVSSLLGIETSNTQVPPAQTSGITAEIARLNTAIAPTSSVPLEAASDIPNLPLVPRESMKKNSVHPEVS